MLTQQPAEQTPPAQEADGKQQARRRAGRLLRWMAGVIAIGLALVYLAASVVVADRLSRPGRNPVEGSPSEFGLAYERVEFPSREDGVPLRGWWMAAQESSRAVILLHGRNSNRAGRNGQLLLRHAQGYVAAGFSVLTFDLRAHGESGRTRYSMGPFERRDVWGAIEYLRERGVPAGQIALVGHSMGAATALLAAAQAPDVAAVVADSPYARLSELLETELPKASGLPALFNPGILALGNALYGIDTGQASPEAIMDRVRPRPVLFIHSLDDATVPVEHARRLWRAARQGPDTLWTVAGPQHDRVFESFPEEYRQRVVAFLDRALK